MHINLQKKIPAPGDSSRRDLTSICDPWVGHRPPTFEFESLSPEKKTLSPKWGFPKIGVPPNHPILIGFFILNHPFWGSPILGNLQICWASKEKKTQPAFCEYISYHLLGSFGIPPFFVFFFGKKNGLPNLIQDSYSFLDRTSPRF